MWGPIRVLGLKLGNIKAKVVLRDERAFIYRNLRPNNEDPAVSWSPIKCINANAAKTTIILNYNNKFVCK